MRNQYCVIYCTCPSLESANKIADKLVKERLVACVNIVPDVTSVYTWQEKCHHDDELLLIMKTKADLFDSINNTILNIHPYKVPEIIAIPIMMANDNYTSWINDICQDV